MPKNHYLLLSILLTGLVFLLGGCGGQAKPDVNQDNGKLEVYTSFYTMADFVGKIGGDRVQVINLVPAGMEPHDWEPTPTEVAGLEKARLFVYHGLGFESWVEKTLNSLSNQNLIVVEASTGILPAGSSRLTAEVDPHLWLNPLYAKRELQNIQLALVEADPEGAQYYEANYERYAAMCDVLDENFRAALAPLSQRDMVVTHAAFGYLCEAYGLNQIALSGLSPEEEPNPGAMAQAIDYVKEHGVKVIFYEELVDPKVAVAIARETGARVDCLSPLEGLNEAQQKAGEDYFSLMEQNLRALVEALQ